MSTDLVGKHVQHDASPTSTSMDLVVFDGSPPRKAMREPTKHVETPIPAMPSMPMDLVEINGSPPRKATRKPH